MTVDVEGVLVHGRYDEKFEPTVAQFARHFKTGEDVGASFALSRDGEMVVDIWAGHLDEDRQQPWQQDTIVNVYSSTKTVSFLCALVLADRGELDFDAPVARYWPEFAQNGKEEVLVWHLMDHAAGLSGLDEPTDSLDVCDWQKMTSLLAAQAPWWPPGSATGYHAVTQGFLIGEVIRRITGKSFGEFLQDEVAGPLAADFLVGVPASEFPRIGKLFTPDESTVGRNIDPDSIAGRTYASPPTKAEDSWTDAWRQAEMPATNGHGNARSLVRLQTPLACGGSAWGVDLVSAETARMIMTPRIQGTDMVLGVPLTFGLGFALNRGAVPLSPNLNTCVWAGWGGSSVLIDQDARVVISYVMNRMFPSLLGDLRGFTLRQQAYRDMG